MKVDHAAEFCFCGSALLPLFLAWSGAPGPALLSLVFLTLAGAVAGIGDPQAPHRVAGDARRAEGRAPVESGAERHTRG